ncbi:unnamed protein product [Sphenostylis stenocarpa]|uniref:Late embryogenesis abundant protein LEA-2 subgroup domain-containing protein n=1 Tax=Sphenostylis stenocarpa TaxID=92480 RepID=A0AA86VK71_9FABA|nr:unnamed protein product [Sphenostylis stenocarpa]
MCMCYRASCCCICSTISIIVIFFILPLIIVPIITAPKSVKFRVTDVFLTQFNLTRNNTLYYNFKVNVTVTNPNNKVTVYYRKITAIAWYKDNAFVLVSLTPFDQVHKNTTFLQAVFVGQRVIKLKSKQLGEYEEETSVGIHRDLAVDFELIVRAS